MRQSCDLIRDLLPLYCDGVCSEASRKEIEIHLRECESCRALAEQMKSPDVEVTIEKDYAKAARLYEEKRKKKSLQSKLTWIAAFTAIVAVIVVFINLRTPGDVSDVEVLIGNSDYYTEEELGSTAISLKQEFMFDGKNKVLTKIVYNEEKALEYIEEKHLDEDAVVMFLEYKSKQSEDEIKEAVYVYVEEEEKRDLLW